jgi:tRNA-dihydrouridine synthase B
LTRASARVKAAVSIPVVANGDVGSPADAAAVLERSGADAVMVGRASYGAPWIVGQIASAARGDISSSAPAIGEAMADYVVEHYEDMLTLYGIESGLRQARKHLGWYLDRHASGLSLALRSAIMTSLDPAEVIRGLRTAFITAADFEPVRTAAWL